MAGCRYFQGPPGGSIRRVQSMVQFFLEGDRIAEFVAHLMKQKPVFAPHRKGQKSFSFERTENPDDVVLDYPRTMHSVKKFFLPPREELLHLRSDEERFRDRSEIPIDRGDFPGGAFLRPGRGRTAGLQLHRRQSRAELPDPPAGRGFHRRFLRARQVPLLRLGGHPPRRQHRLRHLPDQAVRRVCPGGPDRPRARSS